MIFLIIAALCGLLLASSVAAKFLLCVVGSVACVIGIYDVLNQSK